MHDVSICRHVKLGAYPIYVTLSLAGHSLVGFVWSSLSMSNIAYTENNSIAGGHLDNSYVSNPTVSTKNSSLCSVKRVLF